MATCGTQLEKPLYTYFIDIILIIGAFASYFPQYIKIYRNKSVWGINYYSIFLLNLSCFTVFWAALLENWNKIECCYQLGFWGCDSILLPIYQLGISWICALPLYYMIIYYHKYQNDELSTNLLHNNDLLDPVKENKKYKIRLLVAIVYIIIIIIFFATGYYYITQDLDNNKLYAYADFLGTIAALSNIFYLIPQLIQTYQMRDHGNLSMVMLGLQIPGSILVIIFQGIIYQEGIAIWGPYLVSGIMQSSLLGLSIYFIKEKEKNNIYRFDSYIDHNINTDHKLYYDATA